MKFNKTVALILVACLCAGIAGLVFAQYLLTANLGPITVNPLPLPGNLIFSSALLGATNGVISGNGKIVTFSGLPEMTVGDTATLTIVIANDGESSATLNSITISEETPALSITLTSGSVPVTILAGNSTTFVWNVEAVAAGTVNPVIGFN